ncbi:MAG: septal ring lytic transglycosylase RlpA family protein [Pseudomonadota bacterium]
MRCPCLTPPRALLLAALLLPLLNACSSLPKTGGILDTSGDGLPASGVPKNLNPDIVADAVPRNEPRSRYGNPSSYQVEGRRYTVLANAEGYQEQGIASWYGAKFHGRRTSSGEPYDMYAMTAAHTTLPLPSYVQVTNLRNGRKVIVKVNDRGPFRHSRVIDLSYVAALKLGIVAEGTGLVEVKVVTAEDAPAPAAAASAPNPSPDIYLQVGAFAERAKAERLSQRVAPVAPRGAVQIREESGARPLYRVRLGPLSNVEEVDRVTRKLDGLGVNDAHVVID